MSRPIVELDRFVEKAVKLGCYSTGTKNNLLTALGIAREQIKNDVGLKDVQSVGALEENLNTIFRAYGATTATSASSIRTYKSKVMRLLRDYRKRADGDFMKWKEDLEAKKKKRAKARTKSIPKSPSDPTSSAMVVDDDERLDDSPRRQRYLLTGDRWVEIRWSSDDLTETDLKLLETYMSTFKTVVASRSES